MKFDYMVKHNGVYYPKGTDVPIEKEISRGEDAPAVTSGKVDVDYTSEEKHEEMRRKYSEEDLDVPYTKLVALAKKEGFKVERNTKGHELKEMLRSV